VNRAVNRAGAEADLIADGAVSPALVNLLVHSGRVTGDALAATVVDLAARGYVHLEQIAPDEVVARFPVQAPPRGTLAPHEHQALALLDIAVRRGVRTGRLGQGVTDEADHWWDQFAKQVAREGEEAGLDHGPGMWTATAGSILGAVAVVTLFVGCIVAANLVDDPGLASLWVALWVGVGLWGGLVLDRGSLRTPLTPAGIDLGSRWITEREQRLDLLPDGLGPAAVAVRGRELAYACAVGTAPSVARGLPRGPDSTRDAWGQRALAVPGALRPSRMGRPHATTIRRIAGVVLSGAVLVAAAAAGRWHPAPPFSAEAADRLGDLEPIAAGMRWSCSCSQARALEGLHDMVAERRSSRASRGRWLDRVETVAGSSPGWYLVIDDGRSSTLRGLRVSEHAFRHAHRGDVARARVGRGQGFVHEIELQQA
jgi:hypothetical protein